MQRIGQSFRLWFAVAVSCLWFSSAQAQDACTDAIQQATQPGRSCRDAPSECLVLCLEYKIERATRLLAMGGTDNPIETVEADWTGNLTLQEDGLLLVTATARNARNGSTANAGVLVTVSVDRTACTSDQSFEGESATITFHASATCVRWLPAGAHSIRVVRQNQGFSNQGYFLDVKYFVLAVRPAR